MASSQTAGPPRPPEPTTNPGGPDRQEPFLVRRASPDGQPARTRMIGGRSTRTSRSGWSVPRNKPAQLMLHLPARTRPAAPAPARPAARPAPLAHPGRGPRRDLRLDPLLQPIPTALGPRLSAAGRVGAAARHHQPATIHHGRIAPASASRGEAQAELHRTTALTDLNCDFGLGGAPDEIVRRSMMRFAEEVMPLLRSQPR
jgi:hypothetical protein